MNRAKATRMKLIHLTLTGIWCGIVVGTSFMAGAAAPPVDRPNGGPATGHSAFRGIRINSRVE